MHSGPGFLGGGEKENSKKYSVLKVQGPDVPIFVTMAVYNDHSRRRL